MYYGIFFLIWSILIAPVQLGLHVSVSNDYLPNGYFSFHVFGIGLRFHWQLLRNENGMRLSFQAGRRKQHEAKPNRKRMEEQVILLKSSPVLRKAMRDLFCIRHIRIRLRLGLDDAAATALACAFLQNVFDSLPKADSCVSPEFRACGFTAETKCIVFFRLGKLLAYTALYGFMHAMRRATGGAGTHGYAESSHQLRHANGT